MSVFFNTVLPDGDCLGAGHVEDSKSRKIELIGIFSDFNMQYGSIAYPDLFAPDESTPARPW
jgi:hypothetical protein